MYEGKKMLVLGGKPIGSVELVKRAKELGAYVIVTDYLPIEQSPAKRIADECWDISTAEVNKLTDLCKVHHVDGISAGVHEFNINRMLDLCENLNFPCYCKRDTWVYCDDKVEFKKLCISNKIPVARKYDINSQSSEQQIDSLPYPVIVKPVDGSGSRGFHICNNAEELKAKYVDAECFSPTKRVIVEDYMPYDAVIIHYTMHNGKCYFSGMSDKISRKFASTGSSVMGFQSLPSKGLNSYLKSLDEFTRRMFENAGFTDGPIWIEAFYDGTDKFFFNEIGYRFGGSLTNYPVKYFYGIDQLDLMISSALSGNIPFTQTINESPRNYCILPIHTKAGNIQHIVGENDIKSMNNIYAYVPVHFEGDEIHDWGSAQQVFCYIHVLYDTYKDLKNTLNDVMKTIKAIDLNGNNLLFTLFDFNNEL
jgi:biotin carboxylase